jgi:uncharacterized repeat protein (TIGR01451 family)
MRRFYLLTTLIVLALLLNSTNGISQAEQQIPPETPQPASLLDTGEANLQGSRLVGGTASVGVLFDQQPNQVNGIFSDSGCDICLTGMQSIADNFILTTKENIAQIVLWSGYFPADVPIDPDVFTVIFHEDDGGLPGAAIYTLTDLTYTRVQTGIVLFGVHEWMHTLTLAEPVALGPGTYWVEIYNDTGLGTDDFFWETGDPDAFGNGIPLSAFSATAPGSTWNMNAGELAFQLITTDNLPLLYGAANELTGGFGPSNLYAIDHRTGTAVLIGPTGFDNVTGLAFLDDGRLVGSARGDDLYGGTVTAILIEIDPATGAGTLIGVISDQDIGCGRMPDITYDRSTSTLYGYGDYCSGAPEGLFTIDPVTGAGTSVGASGYTGGGNGMAIQPDNGIIYATPFDDNSLITIDPETGAGTEVPGSAGKVPHRVNALDFHPTSGFLYGSWNDSGEPNKLVLISTDDGTTSVIGNTVTGLDALIFAAPRILVDPPSLSSTQVVDEITYHTLTISNAGDLSLDWVFFETPEITGWPGYTAPDAAVLEAPNSNTGLTFALQPGAGVPVSAGHGAKLLYAPSESDDPLWRASLAALISGGVDYFDARAGTPTLAELLPYDAVLTWANFQYHDKEAFGDVLADYVDAGGQVILSAFTTYTIGNHLGGRIMTEPYAPVTSPTGGNHDSLDQYADDGTTFLHNGVDFYQCSYRDELALQGTGQQDGSYLDGEIAVSYRPDLQVIHINGLDPYPLVSFGCSGDYQLIIANAMRGPLPICGVPWASADPITGSLLPGAGIDVEVSFDATGLSAGTYSGALCIESSDPWEPVTTIPVSMTVIIDADLWITKAAPDAVEVGDQITYTLEYGNLGPAPALTTTITDTLPAGVEFVSASNPACVESENVVTCDLNDLPAGGSGLIEIVVLAVSGGEAVNQAAIGSLSPDPDEANNTASTETVIEQITYLFLPLAVR